ncbi:hypothetical protein SESBI_26357 [Sesbania bispinosa]|nr:hypothetical protein SESBI_26357 [Sesbania bispinosa]
MERGERIRENRVIASTEYKEWRKARGVPPPIPMEAVHNEASPATLSQIITTMTSEVERMNAQMTFMEEKADVAGLRITILEAQRRRKDKEIKICKMTVKRLVQMQIRREMQRGQEGGKKEKKIPPHPK